jgi:hypothetical protein
MFKAKAVDGGSSAVGSFGKLFKVEEGLDGTAAPRLLSFLFKKKEAVDDTAAAAEHFHLNAEDSDEEAEDSMLTGPLLRNRGEVVNNVAEEAVEEDGEARWRTSSAKVAAIASKLKKQVAASGLALDAKAVAALGAMVPTAAEELLGKVAQNARVRNPSAYVCRAAKLIADEWPEEWPDQWPNGEEEAEEEEEADYWPNIADDGQWEPAIGEVPEEWPENTEDDGRNDNIENEWPEEGTKEDEEVCERNDEDWEENYEREDDWEEEEW